MKYDKYQDRVILSFSMVLALLPLFYLSIVIYGNYCYSMDPNLDLFRFWISTVGAPLSSITAIILGSIYSVRYIRADKNCINKWLAKLSLIIGSMELIICGILFFTITTCETFF